MIILDQFEVEPRHSLSGSINSNFILGSVLGTRTGSTSTIFNSHRRIFGSRLEGVNNSYFTSVPKWQYSRYFDQVHLRQVAGNVNSISVFDSSFILDSTAPDMVQIALLNNDRIVSGGLNVVSDDDFSTIGGNSGSRNLASVVIGQNSLWLTSFPFQTKYKHLTTNLTTGRQLQIITASMTTLGQVTIENPNGDTFVILDVSSSNPLTNFSSTNIGAYFDDDAAHGGFLLVPIETVKKFFFSFGDGFQPKAGATPEQVARYKSMPEFFVRSFPDPDYLAGPLIRGFRYGLYNANLTQPNVVFRRTKYGQFRDMLEQRKYTATIKANGIDRPCQISFKSGSLSHQRFLIYSTASAPTDFNPNDSGIYDVYYRCGKPFFE